MRYFLQTLDINKIIYKVRAITKNFFYLSILTCLFTLSLPYHTHADHNGKEGHDIAIAVNGLVCDFCAIAIEKVFSEQSSIDNVFVDLNLGFITVDLKENQNILDETLIQMTTDAGYDVTQIIRNN